MRSICTGVFALGAVVLSASAVHAQADITIRGIGGVTFVTESGVLIGGSFAAPAADNVQVTGEFAWMSNVLPNSFQDDLDAVASFLAFQLRAPVVIDAKVRAFYGMTGIRYDFESQGKAKPFVEANVGFGRLNIRVDATAAGVDISDLFEQAAEVESKSNFMTALGGGLGFALNDVTGVDVGARYIRIFTSDPSINTAAVYGALRYKF